MAADAHVAQELQRLAALIEQSGLAERRPDLRALLAAAASARHRPDAPQPQPPPRVRGGSPVPPSRAKRGAKAVTLLRGVLDAAMVLAAGWLAQDLWQGHGEWQDRLWVIGPLAAAWLVLRFQPLRDAGYEAGFRLVYEATFAWDWLAEAFHTVAMLRFARRQAARDVMAAWRHHRGGLGPAPGLDAVEAFLRQEFGTVAAQSFRAAVVTRIGPGGGRTDFILRGGPPPPSRHVARRVEALRWSALIRLFEDVARGGAFWPAHVVPSWTPAPLPEVLRAAPPSPDAVVPFDPDADARRSHALALREALRRKRQNLSETYTWNLKTPGEIAQRDVHAAGLRVEIAAMEAELATLKRAGVG
ncbi:hypothetical protein ACQW02_07545 [Humitalea sp. 24SJ18S-53]|uniref:hypothetical protein n=1 Tax=Humitalea sp. 24SJ18S-53 TaxID=3422307 RepID=UPI003D663C35